MKKRWLTILLLAVAQHGMAQERLTEHTYRLPETASPGAGTFKDVAWLAGSWRGTAFGSQFEAVWNPASAGSMVGLWKLYDEEKGVSFYELLLIKEEGDGLKLMVKHFTPDFVAWEEKDDFVTFRLVKAEADAIHFSGLSFYRRGEDRMDGYIVMTQKDGSRTEHQLVYERVEP